jgi:hypothetical protein
MQCSCSQHCGVLAALQCTLHFMQALLACVMRDDCCCRGTFRDVNGRVYRPDVVRLGSEEALSEEARQVRLHAE